MKSHWASGVKPSAVESKKGCVFRGTGGCTGDVPGVQTRGQVPTGDPLTCNQTSHLARPPAPPHAHLCNQSPAFPARRQVG